MTHLFILAAVSCWTLATGDTVTVRLGLLAPYSGAACFSGFEFWSGATERAEQLNQEYLSRHDVQLEIVPLAASTPFEAWDSARAFLKATPCEGSGTCGAVHAGLLGPSTTAASKPLQFLTQSFGVPLFAYSASANELTWEVGSQGRDPYDSQFLRFCHTDRLLARGIWHLLRHFRWQRFSVVYEETEFGRTIMEDLQREMEANGNPITMENSLGFTVNSTASVTEAAGREFETVQTRRVLQILKDYPTRILVVLASETGGASILAAAERMGMTGKGWTWIGNSWVREFTWRSLSPGRGLSRAARGLVGVVPVDASHTLSHVNISSTPSGPTRTDLPGLQKFMPVAEECPSVNSCPCDQQPDIFLPFVLDAVDSLARASAATVQSPAGDCSSTVQHPARFCPADLVSWIRNGTGPSVPEGSHLDLAEVPFNQRGDRSDVSLHVRNVRNAGFESDRMVAVWRSDSGNTVDSDGHWEWKGTVVWPSGRTDVPSDRASSEESTQAIVLVVVIIGVVLSFIVGHFLHQLHISWLPESGATVILGCITAGILLAIPGDEQVNESVGFDEHLFILVFLPVIIFESGYALDKHPFFSQIGSIFTLAVFGTLMSVLIVGVSLYYFGKLDSILTLSFEESIAFGAVICAVDPVATLAIFSSLRVDPRLNALVYGEAVVNDAVAIVLFRLFSRFLTKEITGGALGEAVGEFLGVLLGSLLAGVFVAVVCTLVFKCIRVDGAGPRHHRHKSRSRSRSQAQAVSATAAPAPAPRSEGSALRNPAEPQNVHGEGMEMMSAHSDAPVRQTSEFSALESRESLPMQGDQVTTRQRSALWRMADPGGVMQTGYILLFSYLAFVFAEGVGLSGIVASLFAGIFMNHYTRKSLSPDGRETSSRLFRMLAFLAETTVFFQVGLNVVLFQGKFEIGFLFCTIALCLVARGIHVFFFAFVLNLGRNKKIPVRHQLVMWHAGLRGAVAYATCVQFPSQNREEIINTTSWTILFTIFVLGGSTTSVLDRLGIERGVERPDNSEEFHAGRIQMSKQAQSESWTKRCFAHLDRRYIRPCLYPEWESEAERLERETRHAQRRLSQQRAAPSTGGSSDTVSLRLAPMDFDGYSGQEPLERTTTAFAPSPTEEAAQGEAASSRRAQVLRPREIADTGIGSPVVETAVNTELEDDWYEDDDDGEDDGGEDGGPEAQSGYYSREDSARDVIAGGNAP